MQYHYASIWETIADAVPDRPALIHGDTSRSWQSFDERAARLAGAFEKAGLKADSKIGHYLYNCNEYIEAHYAAFKMRASPINVNYRYLEEELIYLLDNSDSEAVLFHGRLAERIDRVRGQLPKLKLLVQVDDGEAPLLDGAVDYEAFLNSGDPMPRRDRSEDEIYMLYTGGTTGMPKGVMYSQRDQCMRLMRLGFDFRDVPRPASETEMAANIKRMAQNGELPIALTACPLMHGTGMWAGAMGPMTVGGCAVTVPNLHFDADAVWAEVTRTGATDLVIVGDAFAKPLADALDRAKAAGTPHDLSSLRLIVSSGVMWTMEVKERLLAHHDMTLIDAMGSTEGTTGRSVMTRATKAATARFELADTTKVFSEDDQEVVPGSGEKGLIATGGVVPIGYYKDPEKSAKTFRTVNGVRYTFGGDWATVEADGSITLLGRGSVCINSAGEKIFPEEVEEAVKLNPAIYDCLVVGVPDERFGERVVAVAAPRPGDTLDEADLIAFLRDKLAGYKLPKHVVMVDKVQRAPNGKADYKWAKAAAHDALGLA